MKFFSKRAGRLGGTARWVDRRLCEGGHMCERQNHGETDTQEDLSDESKGQDSRWFPSSMGHDWLSVRWFTKNI
jgi:hypothetical protein